MCTYVFVIAPHGAWMLSVNMCCVLVIHDALMCAINRAVIIVMNLVL